MTTQFRNLVPKGQLALFLPPAIVMLAAFFLQSAPLRIVFYGSAIAMIVLIVNHRQDIAPYMRTVSFTLLGAYLLYMLASIGWSPDPSLEHGLKYLRDAVGIVVFTLFLAFAIARVNPIDWPKIAMLFAAVTVSFSLLYLILFFVEGNRIGGERLYGFGRYQNPIHLAFVQSFAVIALLSIGSLRTRLSDAVRFGMVSALLAGIFLTEARSAFIALIGCACLMPLLGRGRLGLLLLGLGAICALIGMSLWSSAFTDILSRLDNNRFGIWQSAWIEFLQRPWLGRGIDFDPVFNPTNDHPEGWKSTHNFIVGHLYTGGMIGLALICGIIVNMLARSFGPMLSPAGRTIRQHAPHLLPFTCLLVCFAVLASLFNFTHFVVNLHIQWLTFWVPFALCWHFEVVMKRSGQTVEKADQVSQGGIDALPANR